MRVKSKAIIAFTLSLTLVFLCLPGMRVQAKSTLDKIKDAQEEKEQTEDEKEAAEGKKQNAETTLDGLNTQRGTLKERMDALNIEMQQAGENLAKIEDSIALKEAEIAETRIELAEAQAEELNQYESMKKRMQFMYESQDTTYLQMLFSAQSIAELLNAADYINMLAEYDREQLEKYKATVAAVEETESTLTKEAEDLEVLKQSAVDEQDRIAALVQTTADKLTEYADKIDDMEEQVSAYEKEIAQKEEEIKKQEEDLTALFKQYEQELALSRLANESVKRDISEVVFAEGDRYLLANLIYCEAGAEPYEGKVAVGAVVINRVLSSVFPDTVSGVIYQNKQFSPVGNGRLALALAQNKATDSCYQAADAAMSGYTNVGGCVYFRTPIPGLTGIQIGNHIFY